MADRWSLFKEFWKTDDEEAVITDASTANDYMVENSITQFQAASKEITDITVALSSSRADVDETLRKFREAVILAHSYALDNDCKSVRSALQPVLEL